MPNQTKKGTLLIPRLLLGLAKQTTQPAVQLYPTNIVTLRLKGEGCNYGGFTSVWAAKGCNSYVAM